MNNAFNKTLFMLLILFGNKNFCSINVWGQKPTLQSMDEINSTWEDIYRCHLPNASEDKLLVMGTKRNFMLYMSELFQMSFEKIDKNIYSKEQSRWSLIIDVCLNQVDSRPLSHEEKLVLQSINQDMFTYSKSFNEGLDYIAKLADKANTNAQKLLTIKEILYISSSSFVPDPFIRK